MKRLLVFMSMVVGFLLMSTVFVFAQGEEVLKESTGLEVYFVSLAALAAAVVPVTEFIKRFIEVSGNWAQVLSWVVSVGLAFLGWWLKLGMFVDLSWSWVLVYGIAAGLASNGLFDMALIQAILKLFDKK